MKRLKLLLTFDYELPLGGITRSFGHSLFEPVERLADILHRLKVSAVFFADILSYVRFKELNVNEYTGIFEKQLRQMLMAGHDVQLHLHPHWLESRYEHGKIITSPKFKLGDYAISEGEYTIEKIVECGVSELTGICKPVKQAYRCIAYRAGGYNFVPETGRIIKALYNNGIRFDSSVSRGYFFRSDTSLVDYREVPDLPNWYLSTDGEFGKPGFENENTLYEIPIASKPKGVFEIPTVLKLKLKKYASRSVEERGYMIHTGEHVDKKDKIRQFFSSRMLTVDNHTYSPAYLMKILDYNVRRFMKHDEIIMSLIGHPKSLGEYHYFLLSEFVRQAAKKYGSKLEFVTFDEIKSS